MEHMKTETTCLENLLYLIKFGKPQALSLKTVLILKNGLKEILPVVKKSFLPLSSGISGVGDALPFLKISSFFLFIQCCTLGGTLTFGCIQKQSQETTTVGEIQ